MTRQRRGVCQPWAGLGWAGPGWAGMGWAGSGWAGLGWAWLGWAGLGWTGLGWAVLDWAGLAKKKMQKFQKTAKKRKIAIFFSLKILCRPEPGWT